MVFLFDRFAEQLFCEVLCREARVLLGGALSCLDGIVIVLNSRVSVLCAGDWSLFSSITHLNDYSNI